MNVAVLKGGISAEREVSLRSGAAIAEALRSIGHAVTEVDVVDRDFVVPNECEIAFLGLHGTFGEDGEIQALLEQRGVRYTGCGPRASRRAFDKVLSKEAFAAAGVPTPEFEILRLGAVPTMRAPLVVKPAKQGSSVGIVRVAEDGEREAAAREAFRFDDCVLAERWIRGRELTVGILGAEVLPVVEIIPHEGFYDYEHKYTLGRTEYVCPAELAPAVTRAVQDAALRAHRALEGEVYARVDVLLDADDRPWVLESNTLPGMTATSLLPKAGKAHGLTFPELCDRIVRLSMEVKR